jgi:hypothetical protein
MLLYDCSASAPSAERITFSGDLAGADGFASIFSLYPSLHRVRFAVESNALGAPYAICLGHFEGVTPSGEVLVLDDTDEGAFEALYNGPLQHFLLTLGALKDDPSLPGRPGHAAVGVYEVLRSDAMALEAVVLVLDVVPPTHDLMFPTASPVSRR